MAERRMSAFLSSSATRMALCASAVPAHSISSGGGRLITGCVPHHLPFHGFGCLKSGATAATAVARPCGGWDDCFTYVDRAATRAVSYVFRIAYAAPSRTLALSDDSARTIWSHADGLVLPMRFRAVNMA